MRISPLPDAWKQRYSIMLDIRQDLPFVKKNLLFDAPWQVSRYMQVHSLFVLMSVHMGHVQVVPLLYSLPLKTRACRMV